MKNFKRFASVVMVIMMMLSMMLPAMAAMEGELTGGSITINDAVAGEEYKIYQILYLESYNASTNAYSYKANSAWANWLATQTSYVAIDAQGYVTWVEGADVTAFAAAARAFAKTLSAADATKVAESTTVQFTELKLGYYLVDTTLGTLCSLDTTTPDVVMNEKNPEDTITKEVKEDSTGDYGASNDAQIGDTVEFISVVTLNPHTTNVSIHDTMDSGLTYNNDVSIEGLNEGTDYTVNNDPEDGCTFCITFTDTYLISLEASTTLTVTYTAVLNKDVITATPTIDDQVNKIVIKYGNAQSVEVTTTTTTHKFAVNKWAENFEDLADAEFSLKKAGTVVKLIKIDDNNYRVAERDEEGAVKTFITVANGDIVIWGVDADADYTLKEEVAPNGYNILPEEVKVTVTADNNLTVNVENNSGTELPSTGGIGTTIFYCTGAVLALGAFVLLITKKRMSRES